VSPCRLHAVRVGTRDVLPTDMGQREASTLDVSIRCIGHRHSRGNSMWQAPVKSGGPRGYAARP
jgi:hypothetical protein